MNLRTRITLHEPHPHMGPLISNYQDGVTTPAQTETVERHLLECERCHAFYASLQHTREVISNLPVPARNLSAQHSEAEWLNILNRTAYHHKKGGRPLPPNPIDKLPAQAKKRPKSKSR